MNKFSCAVFHIIIPAKAKTSVEVERALFASAIRRFVWYDVVKNTDPAIWLDPRASQTAHAQRLRQSALVWSPTAAQW
ncbi:MAG TPA: hypothetical protein VGB81_07130, partial [Devosia sp.]